MALAPNRRDYGRQRLRSTAATASLPSDASEQLVLGVAKGSHALPLELGPTTNVSDDDEATTGKIAWAHPNGCRDYYPRLCEMQTDAQRYWSPARPGIARVLSEAASSR